jgi:Tfp pilus assembly protein PilN
MNARRRDSALQSWSLVLVATLLLIAVPSALLSINLRTSKPNDSDHVTQFVNDLQNLQNAIPPLKKKLAILEAESQSQRRSESRVQWTSVLNHLASISGNDIRIHTFNASIETNTSDPKIEFTIQIFTSSLSQAREFLVVLESTGLFDKINMLDSRRQSSAQDSLVNSTIKAQIVATPTSEASK